MNILHLTNGLNYVDGVTTHLYYLLKSLKNFPGINIFLMCSGGDAVNKFKDTGINVIEDSKFNHNNRNFKNYAAAMYSVYKFTKSENIQIVHSHNHYAANISAGAFKFSNFRTVQTNHGIIDEGGRLKHFSSGYYIVLNETILKYFQQYKIASENKINLIYNGIDFPDEIIKKKSVPFKIIAASRLEKGKGLTTFIKAISILPEEIKKKIEIFIAGTGTLEEELKLLNTKSGAGVNFIGKQINLIDVLKNTDMFVIPSESGNEAFPMTLLEAAAANNLIISSDFTGIEDILNDRTEGFVFKKNDEKDLAAKIKFVIENPDIAGRISHSFFIKAKKIYNSELMVSKHIQFYESILNDISK